MQIAIHGTFDVAKTRNQLRKLAEIQGWQTTLRARTAAALTSLSEVLFFHTPVAAKELLIDIATLDEMKRQGVLFECRIPANPLLRDHLELRCSLLQQASNEFHHIMDTYYDTITLAVWDERSH